MHATMSQYDFTIQEIQKALVHINDKWWKPVNPVDPFIKNEIYNTVEIISQMCIVSNKHKERRIVRQFSSTKTDPTPEWWLYRIIEHAFGALHQKNQVYYFQWGIFMIQLKFHNSSMTVQVTRMQDNYAIRKLLKLNWVRHKTGKIYKLQQALEYCRDFEQMLYTNKRFIFEVTEGGLDANDVKKALSTWYNVQFKSEKNIIFWCGPYRTTLTLSLPEIEVFMELPTPAYKRNIWFSPGIFGDKYFSVDDIMHLDYKVGTELHLTCMAKNPQPGHFMREIQSSLPFKSSMEDEYTVWTETSKSTILKLSPWQSRGVTARPNGVWMGIRVTWEKNFNGMHNEKMYV